MKPIHKFNNGNGATLCHICRTIISEGHTDDLYCKICKPIVETINKSKQIMTLEELIKTIDIEKLKSINLDEYDKDLFNVETDITLCASDKDLIGYCSGINCSDCVFHNKTKVIDFLEANK